MQAGGLKFKLRRGADVRPPFEPVRMGTGTKKPGKGAGQILFAKIHPGIGNVGMLAPAKHGCRSVS
jgi:hypothetical protein